MQPLSIDVSKIVGTANVRMISLKGSVDALSTPRLMETVENLRREGVTGFIFDMERVDYLNSTGLGMLVHLADAVEPTGGSVALVRVGDKVQSTFDTLGLNEFFRRFKTRDEATRSFQKGGPPVDGRAAPPAPERTAVLPQPPVPPPPPDPAADTWRSPLAQRYAGPAMLKLFSDRKRFATWRDLWIALAEAEKELGLPISEAQIGEMRAARDRTDTKRAAEIERETRHDVMAHIRHFGEQAPGAAGIIHLGATSMYVVDNTDLILMREGLDLLIRKVARACRALATFAKAHRDIPTMGYTHLQPAQVTTVGRRACLWLQDFLLDLRELQARRDGLLFLGVKGAIGTQASFLALFDGDRLKVEKLDRIVTDKMGFKSAFRVTGQTYTRKVDAQVLAALSGIAQSAAKFSNDVRLSQSRFEMQEPFEKGQVGSSAMAYKQNPMKSERIAGLARFVMNLEANMPQTAAAQWFERTLDDSANKRLTVPEAFLSVDAILNLVVAVAEGLVVYPKVIENSLRQELPFLVTEDLLMAGVKAGGNRQELHELIRKHAVEAARRVREEGRPNDLIAKLLAEPAFGKLGVKGEELLDAARYTGRAAEQVDLFLQDEVDPALKGVADVADGELQIKV